MKFKTIDPPQIMIRQSVYQTCNGHVRETVLPSIVVLFHVRPCRPCHLEGSPKVDLVNQIYNEQEIQKDGSKVRDTNKYINQKVCSLQVILPHLNPTMFHQNYQS